MSPFQGLGDLVRSTPSSGSRRRLLETKHAKRHCGAVALGSRGLLGERAREEDCEKTKKCQEAHSCQAGTFLMFLILNQTFRRLAATSPAIPTPASALLNQTKMKTNVPSALAAPTPKASHEP